MTDSFFSSYWGLTVSAFRNYHTFHFEKNNFFSQAKELFKKGRYLNLDNLNNRNAIAKNHLRKNVFHLLTLH